jgi:hypothetical protein
MFDREVKDFSVYSWLFVTAGFYPVSTDDLLEANVRFCLNAETGNRVIGDSPRKPESLKILADRAA